MHPESQKTLFDMFELTTRRVELVKKTFPFQNNQIDGCDAGSLRARSVWEELPGPGLHPSLQLKCDTEVLIRAAGLPLMQVCSRWPPSHPQYNERRLEVSLLNSEWNPFDINDRLVVITQQNLATYFPFCSIRVRENVLSYVILIIYPRNSIQQQRRHPRLKRKYLFIILFIL